MGWILGETAIDGLHKPTIFGIAQQFDPPSGRQFIQSCRQLRIVRCIIHNDYAGIASNRGQDGVKTGE